MKSSTKPNRKTSNPPSFQVTDLKLPCTPIDEVRLAINDYGQVVGTMAGSPIIGSEQAFLWQPKSKNAITGTLYTLPPPQIPPPQPTSYAVAINGNGCITGYIKDVNRKMAQAIWTPDKPNTVPTAPPQLINPDKSFDPTYFFNNPYGGINDLGRVASNEYDPSRKSVRAVFYDGKIHELAPNFWGARAINSNSQVVGHSSAPYPMGAQAVRWIPDPATIGHVGFYKYFLEEVPLYYRAQAGAAWDVNDQGDAVVGANVPDGADAVFSPHVIIWKQSNTVIDFTEGLDTQLHTPAGSPRQAFGINNHGCVVGTVNSRAFLYQYLSDLAYDLNDCIAANKFVLGKATAINAIGQIAATGAVNGNVPAGFLLTPS